MKNKAFSQSKYIDDNRNIFSGSLDGLCFGLSLTWLDSKIKKRGFNKYSERTKIKSRVLTRQESMDRRIIRTPWNGDDKEYMMRQLRVTEGVFRSWGGIRGCEFIYSQAAYNNGSSYVLANELANQIIKPCFSAEVYGVISIFSTGSAHSMAWSQKNEWYDFFDANTGSFLKIHEDHFSSFFTDHIRKYYSNFDAAWDIVKLGPPKKRGGLFSCFGR